MSNLTQLRHRVHVLEADQRRLYRLLARTLELATADDRRWIGFDVHGDLVVTPAITDPTELLERLARLEGTDLARPAWVEEQEAESRAAA